MLIVISPAKSLDFERPVPVSETTQPRFLDHSEALIGLLRQKEPAEIARLMGISDKLAALNVARYMEWSRPFTPGNARQAMYTFNGDVYEGLDAMSLTPEGVALSQKNLRMLSGLYGVLRPLDLMQAYRLEMGIRLANPAGKDLYTFWGDTITDCLNEDLDQCEGECVLVNLASEEYFKSVRPAKLKANVVTPVFEERKADTFKIVSFHAKRARGLMTRYALDHRIDRVEGLKAFDVEGYVFEPRVSGTDRWVFRRG